MIRKNGPVNPPLRLPRILTPLFDRADGMLNVLCPSRYRFWVLLSLNRSDHRLLRPFMVIQVSRGQGVESPVSGFPTPPNQTVSIPIKSPCRDAPAIRGYMHSVFSQEFAEHGMSSVRLTHQNVCNDGFTIVDSADAGNYRQPSLSPWVGDRGAS